jgi:hypothetical protein
VGHLYFITGRNKLTAIPKASGFFSSKNVSERGNGKHYPSGNVIDFSEIHTKVVGSF